MELQLLEYIAKNIHINDCYISKPIRMRTSGLANNTFIILYNTNNSFSIDKRHLKIYIAKDNSTSIININYNKYMVVKYNDIEIYHNIGINRYSNFLTIKHKNRIFYMTAVFPDKNCSIDYSIDCSIDSNINAIHSKCNFCFKNAYCRLMKYVNRNIKLVYKNDLIKCMKENNIIVSPRIVGKKGNIYKSDIINALSHIKFVQSITHGSYCRNCVKFLALIKILSKITNLLLLNEITTMFDIVQDVKYYIVCKMINVFLFNDKYTGNYYEI